jgi:predicted transcriptional regulator
MDELQSVTKYITELMEAGFKHSKINSEDRVEYSIFDEENKLILTITMYKQ